MGRHLLGVNKGPDLQPIETANGLGTVSDIGDIVSSRFGAYVAGEVRAPSMGKGWLMWEHSRGRVHSLPKYGLKIVG